jgi:hypothetical protein
MAGQESLAITGLEKEWKAYPVLHLDLTGESYRNADPGRMESGLGGSIPEQRGYLPDTGLCLILNRV